MTFNERAKVLVRLHPALTLWTAFLILWAVVIAVWTAVLVLT